MPATAFEHGPPRSRIVLYREDCIANMARRVEPGSVDVVVTSPPYNLGVRYGRYDDAVPRQQYLEWIDAWAAAVCGVLSERGSLFLNIGGKPSDPWGPFEVVSRLRQRFHLQNTIHWIKSIAIDADLVGAATGITRSLAVGHYKPINSRRFLHDCHEYVFHLTRSGDVELDRLAIGVEYQDKSNVARWAGAGGDRRCRGNTWFVPYETIQNREKDRPHPATFPPRLPEYCLKLHGLRPDLTVADPFLGLGSTLVACARLGVHGLGIELDEHYLKEAVARVRAAAETPAGKSRRRSAV
jgi:site-specific DNA-methyltransferase (adenine-specific)